MDTTMGFLGRKRNSIVSRWIALIIGLVLLFFFITSGLPFLSQAFGFTEQHQIIIEEDIWAGEWFYIFVEQIRDIEPRVKHTMKYTPGMQNIDPAE